MQPTWLIGHSRPVRQVLHNYDGDLLFTCSDDSKICVYNTFQCQRTGVFNNESACYSLDVTKDSKYCLATAAVTGVNIFNVATGEKVKEVKVDGNQSLCTKLAFGDKMFFCMFKYERICYIRVFDLDNVLKCKDDEKPKVIKEFKSAGDNIYTYALWGSLNKTIYASTTTGKVLSIDYSSGRTLKEMSIHRAEIF